MPAVYEMHSLTRRADANHVIVPIENSNLNATAASFLPAAADGFTLQGREPFSFGWNQPPSSKYWLTYGFWPWYWTTDTVVGQAVTGHLRPGGQLTSLALRTADNALDIYVIRGDTQSVNAIYPIMTRDCNLVNATVPASLSGNTTIESYRDESFQLLRFGTQTDGTATPVGVSTTVEDCLKLRVVTDLLVATTSAPLISAAHTATTPALAPLSLLTLFITLLFVQWRA